MTARQRRGSRATAKVFSDAMSVMSHRTNRSASLPSIAGIGLGIQDVRPVAVSSVPVTRTTKSFPTIVRPGKSVVSRAVQVSSNEENLFLSKIKVLEKEILSLKSCLKEKEHLVTELDGTIKTQTLQFTRDLEHQINDHKSTRQSLEMSQRLVKEKEQLLDERIQHYEKVMRELQDQYEETLASLREQSQIEVNTRDERINKLKQQISELFKDKSWEHQKQIEDLQKEVKRLAEEAHMLRGQLRRHSVSSHECEKCKSVMAALEDSRLQLQLKNRTIEELQSICQRFQNQLQEQGKLQTALVGRNNRNQK
ncbi:GRIP1-associated protein 1-like isoform X1 [Eleutherodactylus coqui]|uniref:GRIP1-associated protein 1-like isoform X1 n=1 Tax=Eleutherodactylus coqui TaxID=57060 RepID=UPI00346302EA